jgi:uncharacterized protein YcbK (DUF882 family)
MANHAAVTIPLENIQRVQVYINEPRKTLAQIKAETGADYLLNGTLYNLSTGAVNCHLKVDGKVIAKPNYVVAGYGWNVGSDIAMVSLPSPAENYIACTLLIEGGKKKDKLYYDPGQGGSRGRSAIGIKNGRLALYCTKDGSEATRTPEKLRDDLFNAGWESAVMLDGGGSSQCDFNGQKITASRKVQHLILVYLRKEDTVTVNVYSKAKDGEKKLSANFRVREFACQDGSDPVFVSPKLVEVLQQIRDHFGVPITVNSAYRTPNHNKSVGGTATSQHLYGLAADIVVSGIAPAKVAAYAETLLKNTGGIGIYSDFTHIDVRFEKSRWNG